MGVDGDAAFCLRLERKSWISRVGGMAVVVVMFVQRRMLKWVGTGWATPSPSPTYSL